MITHHFRYKLYLITPKTKLQADLLHQFYDDPNFNVIHESRVLGSPARIMAAPEVQEYFEKVLKRFTSEGLEYTVLANNVQE